MLRTQLIIFNILILIALAFAGVYPNFRYQYETTKSVNNDWWKTAVFYQIYPRSFMDSDGDGIGDLKGITSKLSYLKEIGVTATWLSPIFKSPMKDFGYDISDFYDIHEKFGTMDDFTGLVEKAKSLDIKIILDFVPNHSSNECKWFTDSEKKIEPYTDYYVWHEGIKNPAGGRNLPPSNWISVFRNSAWEWSDTRKEYYLHQFTVQQPDFNFNSKAVKDQMKDILKFWLDKGVDGFRIDAVPHVFECAKDDNGNFRNEPKRDGATDPNDYGYLIHNCTVDQNETLDLVYDWRKFMDEYQTANKRDALVLLTEQWSPIDITMQYYANDKGQLGSHIPFNFFIISNINNDTNAVGYANVLNMWLERMDDIRIPNWVLGNHDKNRIGSRLGVDRIDMMNMMTMTLPGIAVTYQGEEIGMTDVWISWKDTLDPQACNSNEESYEKLSRDPERTPFQWDDSHMGGFTKGNKTWLPMAKNFNKVNVKRERGIERSKLNLYKSLRALRNDNVFKGNFKATVKAINDNVLAILRSENKQHYVTLMNINDNVETINLKTSFKDLTDELEYAIVTDQSPHVFGDTIKSSEIVLLPKEAVVLRSINSKGALDDYYYYNVIN